MCRLVCWPNHFIVFALPLRASTRLPAHAYTFSRPPFSPARSTPHTVLPRLRSCIRPGAVAVSLIKGLDFNDDGPVLITDLIREGLGERASEVCVLMGANVADEMARDEFCEATIGCHDTGGAGRMVQQLFDCPTFRVEVTPDPLGVELCGALKNVVALGAGFCDGLGWGGNSKVCCCVCVLFVGLPFMLQIGNTPGPLSPLPHPPLLPSSSRQQSFAGAYKKCDGFARSSTPTSRMPLFSKAAVWPTSSPPATAGGTVSVPSDSPGLRERSHGRKSRRRSWGDNTCKGRTQQLSSTKY